MRRPLDDAEMNEIIKSNGYLCPKKITGNRVAAIVPFIYTHAIITMNQDEGAKYGYEDRWCYHNLVDAAIALSQWDGEGEPDGWHRHPDSGRRRKDGKEWVEP